ncbi:hypothetical protein YWIDRAFT_08322 [Streptomyces sp. SceaMP-e96]|uniref:hypothetical protein n=1 Tax=unclassified Streptomyces TaxID=2593676 RepID=UPI000823987C|nr:MULTISPECIES: hypothetical protein [unclassified Streptomyces]MYT18584.1 hypothetical protein [Streptomyces sp. SID4951]SCK57561.1 hypothetical protein YWIDRAFT_08322 [Streptomyces sp. SceaMP-e96]
MIRTIALRALPAVAATGAPALPLARGAQAAAPTPVAPATAAVGHPGQVRRGDTDFMQSHPRVEVRYGNLGPPDRARVVASAATLM